MGRFLLTQVASVAELEAARQPWQPQRPVAFGSATQTARALKGKQVGNREAIAKVKANARERASNLSAILAYLRAEGITSVRRIADELNQRGVMTPRGAAWHPTSVVQLLQHLQPASPGGV